MPRLYALVEVRRTKQRDRQRHESRKRDQVALNDEIEFVLHLLQPLRGGIEDQSVLKDDAGLETGLDHLDLRQEQILPLVVGLVQCGIEAFDSAEQAETAGLPHARQIANVRKEIAGDEREPPRHDAFLDQALEQLQLVQEERAVVAVEVIVDEQDRPLFGITSDLRLDIAEVINRIIAPLRSQGAEAAVKVAVTAGLHVIDRARPREQIEPGEHSVRRRRRAERIARNLD